MVETLAYFNDKARREGLLALYEVVDDGLDDVFLKKGLSLILDGNDAETVRYVLTVSMEREHDFYRKKLMGIAIEGLLAIASLTRTSLLIFRLNLLVDIKDNPIDAAYEKCLSGDREAFLNIDFSSAIVNEHMREEVRFIKRAFEMSNIARREGLLPLEKHLDADAVAKRDVFEYGLSLLFYDTMDIWQGIDHRTEHHGAVLAKLVERESDPVQKNLAAAKREAVMSIVAYENPWVLAVKVIAYFDKDIAAAAEKAIFDDDGGQAG
ncbi:MAG: hypothetical protein FWB82_07415, partial [Treponema sp.]|nr:hypothetical protein [Treponema sp.]